MKDTGRSVRVPPGVPDGGRFRNNAASSVLAPGDGDVYTLSAQILDEPQSMCHPESIDKLTLTRWRSDLSMSWSCPIAPSDATPIGLLVQNGRVVVLVHGGMIQGCSGMPPPDLIIGFDVPGERASPDESMTYRQGCPAPQ